MRPRLAALALLLLAVAAAPAGAQVPSWGAPRFVDHPPPYSAAPAADTEPLAAISCPTASLCVAVDDLGNILTSTSPGTNPGRWSITYLDRRPAALVGGGFAISCPSRRLCVATDNAGNVLSSRDPTGGAGRWKVVHVINVDTGLFLPGAAGGGAISCPSTKLCVAVNGGDVLASAQPTGSRREWRTTDIDSAVAGPLDGLFGISCPTTSFCAAVDTSGNVFLSRDPGARHPRWTMTHAGTVSQLWAIGCASPRLCVAISAGTITSSTDPARSASWRTRLVDTDSAVLDHTGAVSCTSATLCAAIDSAGDVLYSPEPAGGPAPWWVGARPPPAGLIPPIPSGEAVSCTKTSLCVAVDSFGDGLISPSGHGSGTWHADLIDAFNGIPAISCQAGPCAGVDGEGNVLTSANPGGDSGAWALRHVDAHALTAVACPTESLCVAVDGAGGVVTSTDPFTAHAGWSTADIDAAAPLEAVSCPSAALCVAVDAFGRVLTSTDPPGGSQAWTSVAIDDTYTSQGESSGLTAVSCPTTSLCVAADTAGNIVSSTDPTGGSAEWTVWSVDPDSSGITSVSCASASMCVAADGAHVMSSTDPSGGLADWNVTPSTLGQTSVVCRSRSDCLALNQAGVIETQDPLAPDPTWRTSLHETLELSAISCGPEVCAAGNGVGDIVVGRLRR
jgi:hypothetical protein